MRYYTKGEIKNMIKHFDAFLEQSWQHVNKQLWRTKTIEITDIKTLVAMIKQLNRSV